MVNNVSLEPTFLTSVRREVLNLTISSTVLSYKITNWRVSSEPLCSDHRHIQFNITLNKNKRAYENALTYSDSYMNQK